MGLGIDPGVWIGPDLSLTHYALRITLYVIFSFSAILRRALRLRGLARTSSALASIGLEFRALRVGWRPQTHTGYSGGQMQPRWAWRIKSLTARSSSEWKEMTA